MKEKEMKVEIISEELVLDDFFRIYKASLRHELFNGRMSDAVKRYSVKKAEAVAVLVYHTQKDEYILVRQFRYPLYDKESDPWLVEIVAGGIEENEEAPGSASREVKEETGYMPLHLQKITACYVSPGIMNEKVNIYFAEVDESSRINEGGGAKDEDEDIELFYLPRTSASAWLENQVCGDAKTIIAIQWHLQQFALQQSPVH